MSSPVLEQRLRRFRSRQLIRQWQYRQRDLAHGVWFRLRRVLADARAAYAISAEDAATLEAEGARAEPAGREVAPPLALYVVPPDRIPRLRSARPIAVRLSAELFSADAVAMVPFSDGDGAVSIDR
jgi:hypothetical protein